MSKSGSKKNATTKSAITGRFVNRKTASGKSLPSMADRSVVGYTEKRGGPSDKSNPVK